MEVNLWARRALAGLGIGTKARPEQKPEFWIIASRETAGNAERKVDGNSIAMIGVHVGGFPG